MKRMKIHSVLTTFNLFVLSMLFSANPVFSQNQKRLTYNQMTELRITPENERNYAGEECCFVLKIPYAKADSVQASIPDFPSGVNFVSMRRSDYSEEETGTKIELWLNFPEAGTYRLNVMRVTINGKIYPIRFSPVTIYENPKDMSPLIVVQFSNGETLVQSRKSRTFDKAIFQVQAGLPLEFTVYLQYAFQLVSFYWTVPKDSLFVQTEQFDSEKERAKNSEISDRLIPIASFEWKPLVVGKMNLPKMSFVATSYNGTRSELFLPDAFIEVVERTDNEEIQENYEEKYFSEAFINLTQDENKKEEKGISKADCNKLSKLRSLEKKSFPFGKAYKERKAFEKNLGFGSEESEASFVVLYFVLFVSVVFLSLSVLFAVLKKRKKSVVFSSLFLFSFVFFAILFFKVNEKSAIFAGGKISSVPENSSESVEAISMGRKVRIEEKAGTWVYIRYGDSGGWTKEENIIPIE